MTSLQWGRWFTPAETRVGERLGGHERRFNGAAGLHQRKPHRRTEHPPRPVRASMGPLVYTSGNLAAFPPFCQTWTSLQWGRWFTPAETRGAAAAGHCVGGASMGPLVYTSGNHRYRPAVGRPEPCFNGAAGLHQRKLGDMGIDCLCRSCFNGAAGLHQRKPAVCPPRRTGGSRLQWGRWFTPAETRMVVLCTTDEDGLQWGRWFTPAETRSMSIP